MKLQRRDALLGMGAMMSLPLSSWAQSYPSQTIKLIMPFVPGTSSENALRVVLDRLSESL